MDATPAAEVFVVEILAERRDGWAEIVGVFSTMGRAHEAIEREIRVLTRMGGRVRGRRMSDDSRFVEVTVVERDYGETRGRTTIFGIMPMVVDGGRRTSLTPQSR